MKFVPIKNSDFQLVYLNKEFIGLYKNHDSISFFHSKLESINQNK